MGRRKWWCGDRECRGDKEGSKPRRILSKRKAEAETTKTQDGQRKRRGLLSLQAAENGIRVEKRKYNRSKPVNKSIISTQKNNDLRVRKSKKFKNGNEEDQHEEFVYMDLGEVEELALEEKRQQLGSTVASPASSSDSEDLSDYSLLGLASAEQSPQPARTDSRPVANKMKKAKISLSKIKLSDKAATSCERPVSEQAVGNSWDWNVSDDSLLGLLSSAQQSPQPTADGNRSEQPVGDQAEGDSWSKLSLDWNLSDDSLLGLLSSAEQSPQRETVTAGTSMPLIEQVITAGSSTFRIKQGTDSTGKPMADENRSEQTDGDQAVGHSLSKLSPDWNLSDNSLLGLLSSAEQSPQPTADENRSEQPVGDQEVGDSWSKLSPDWNLSDNSLLGPSSAELSPQPDRITACNSHQGVTANNSLPVVKLMDIAGNGQPVEDGQSWKRFLASDSDLSGDSLLGPSSAEKSPQPVSVSGPVMKEMEIAGSSLSGIKQDVVTAKKSLPVIKLEDIASTSQMKNEDSPGIRVPGLDPTATNLRQLLLGKDDSCLIYVFLPSVFLLKSFFQMAANSNLDQFGSRAFEYAESEIIISNRNNYLEPEKLTKLGKFRFAFF